MNTRLTGISLTATRQILGDVADAWRHRGGDVAFESGGGAEAARRVRDGKAIRPRLVQAPRHAAGLTKRIASNHRRNHP